MTVKLVKIENLSGEKASIYSVVLNEEKNTLFNKFLSDYYNDYQNEISNIVTRLRIIGQKEGARLGYFKQHEGIPGDGGIKDKKIRALQEDTILTETNYFIRKLSQQITQKIRNKEIRFSEDGLEFVGDMEIIME